MNRDAAVFFLSDFGTTDEFVGVVHAVLHRFAPRARVVDLTHHVAPFDVAAGADVLERAVDALGPGVVLAVVDPGVGTRRRPIAIVVEAEFGPTVFVGPDNGLLVAAAERQGPIVAVHELTWTMSTGAVTFDGRDRFAPAAAFLVAGGDPAERYPSIDPTSLVRLPVLPEPTGVLGVDAGATASVRSVDHYGNASLNRGGADRPPLGTVVEVTAGARRAKATVVAAFGDLDAGALGLLVDSSGRLALAVNAGSAASRLGLVAGAMVVVEPTA